MIKFVAAGLAAFLLLLAGVALGADQGVQAGFPNCTNQADDDGDTLIDALDPECQATPTASPTPAPTASPSPAPTTAPTATGGTGSPSASPSRSASPLPAAAPQTGGQPGSGSDTLVLTLVLGAAAVIGAAGVFAGKYALERRS